MHAVIGRVKIKPGRAEEALAMIGEGRRDAEGHARCGWWLLGAESNGELIQHSFWLFDTEENARAAEATFNRLREMPDAPATFVSVDVCDVIGQA